MHSMKHVIVIDKPPGVVFAASLNPKNTPLWIDGIVEERASDSRAKLDTIYRNRSETGGWSEYEVTEFEQDKSFTLSRKDGAYHVRYTFTPLANNQVQFEYFEWEDGGKLEESMPYEAIQKFKQLIER